MFSIVLLSTTAASPACESTQERARLKSHSACCPIPSLASVSRGYLYSWRGADFASDLTTHFNRYAAQHSVELCAAARKAQALHATINATSIGLDLSALPSDVAETFYSAYYGFNVGGCDDGCKHEIDQVFNEDIASIRRASAERDEAQHPQQQQTQHPQQQQAQHPQPLQHEDAGPLFANLSAHGFVQIEGHAGLDVAQLKSEVMRAVQDKGISERDELAYFGARLPALDPVLRNPHVRAAVQAYFGSGAESEVTGYAILHLGRHVSTDDYKVDATRTQRPNGAHAAHTCALIRWRRSCLKRRVSVMPRVRLPASLRRCQSGQWHHDRCGRRLKMFVYLDDVGPRSHPTWIARGTHRFAWFGIQSDELTRFSHEYVNSAFGERLIPMHGRRGGGFLFDTNSTRRAAPKPQTPHRLPAEPADSWPPLPAKPTCVRSHPPRGRRRRPRGAKRRRR